MLQAIRSKTGSIVVKALAGLLILAFAAWGVEDFISSRATETSVANVGGIDIDPFEFEYEVQRETQRMRRTFGGQLTDEQLIGLGVGNSVLQRMINDTALTQKSRDVGLRVSDDQVTRTIHSNPTFHGFDGRFSRTRFHEVILSTGYPEGVYIERTRAQLANSQLLDAVASGVMPDRLTDIVKSYQFETRAAEIFFVQNADQPEPAEPSEQDLSDFHQAQAQRFTAPEYRTMTYVHLDPDALMETISVTNEELQDAYDANASEFIRDETRRVQQMVLDTEEDAQRALQQLNEGRDFIEVAQDVGRMEVAAIELGTMTLQGLLPSLGDPVFAVEQGGYTDPIETPLGWHILRAAEVNAGEVRTLDDVRDEVRALAARDRAIDAIYDLSIRFEDAIGGGATVEEAATDIGATTVVIGPVDRDGQTQAGTSADRLPAVASVLPVAFAAERGVESPLTEAGERGFFMVRVDEIIAPALRPLDTVRDDVTAAWRDQQRAEMAEKQASELAERVRAGTSLASLAGDLPGEIETVGPLGRNSQLAGRQAVVRQMFELPPLGAGIARLDDGYAVLKVTAVNAPEPGSGDVPDTEDFAGQMRDAIGQDLIVQLLDAIRTDYGVTVYERVYEQVLEPGPYNPHGNQRQAPF